MDAITVIQAVGIPMACLMGLSFAVWAAMKWAAKYILKPAVDTHLKLVNQLTNTLSAQERSTETIASATTKLYERLDQVAEKLEQIAEQVGQVHGKVFLQTSSVVIQPAKAVGDDSGNRR